MLRAHRHTGGAALTGHLGGDALRRPEHSAALFSKHGVTVGTGVDKAGQTILPAALIIWAAGSSPWVITILPSFMPTLPL